MGYEVKEFTVHGDDTGSLIAIEALRDIPFVIRRVYYVYDTVAGAVRGRHAHKKLEQVIFCPKGSCGFILDNKDKYLVIANRPVIESSFFFQGVQGIYSC